MMTAAPYRIPRLADLDSETRCLVLALIAAQNHRAADPAAVEPPRTLAPTVEAARGGAGFGTKKTGSEIRRPEPAVTEVRGAATST
jgi:hypothetical protein